MQLLDKLINKQDLTEEEAKGFIDLCAKVELTVSQIASFLTALSIKGETVEEIVGLISGMRQYMTKISAPAGTIDTCGTGGDGAKTFNISTAVALVVAGAGVRVAKHGNRAASSKCGSADVLEELGVNINLTPEAASQVLSQVGLVFLFAPLYHPVMKIIGPVRKELGFRTVFNLLGPFLNPAGVGSQVIGVPTIALAKKLAKVAKHLNYQHLILVSSEDGLDEASIAGSSLIIEIKGQQLKQTLINPRQFGLAKASLKDIEGGDAASNARIITHLLSGALGPKRDIVLLNSALALMVAGKAATIERGIALAKVSIDTGQARNILEHLIKRSTSLGKH